MSETQSISAKQPGWFSRLANPTRFIQIADRLIPWLTGIAMLLLAAGLYMGFTAPEDYQQGITVRIMFIHVPSAWLAMMCYSVMAIASIGTLVWRHPLADVAAKTALPIGAAEVVQLAANAVEASWLPPTRKAELTAQIHALA